MGNLLSCGFSRAFPHYDVVKLVHSNGLVEEFYRAVRVRELSVDYPHHFICSSGDLRRIRSGTLQRLSEEDSMELGQIYFLLPTKVFEFPLTQADVAALFSKAGVKRKASYKELYVNVQQVSPLTMPAEGGQESEDVLKPQQPDLALSKELIHKLLAETRLKLQSAMVNPQTASVEKGQIMLPELQAAYTRHILARSCTKLWRPPLETIEEGSFSISLSDCAEKPGWF